MRQRVYSTSEGSTDTESKIQFTRNRASHGGGVYLELNSLLYIFKPNPRSLIKLNFTENSAACGGAVYVQDYSFVETCTKGEVDYENHDGTYCFVQVTSNEEIQDFSEVISLAFYW